MRGLSKRKGSDLWQGRFRIPQHLWNKRDDLRALGLSDIGKSQEFTRSTGKGDRAEAGEAYRKALAVWDDKMRAWESLLQNGPQSLSLKQTIALAGGAAKAFLAAHEDEPFEAPAGRTGLVLPSERDAVWGTSLQSLPTEDRMDLLKDLGEISKADEGRQVPPWKNCPLLEMLPLIGQPAGARQPAGNKSDDAPTLLAKLLSCLGLRLPYTVANMLASRCQEGSTP